MSRDYSKIPKRLRRKAKELDGYCDSLEKEMGIVLDWRNNTLIDKEGKKWKLLKNEWEVRFAFQDNIPFFRLTEHLWFVAFDWTPSYNEMVDGPLKYK